VRQLLFCLENFFGEIDPRCAVSFLNSTQTLTTFVESYLI
jgi:hypothetical protein